MLNVDELKKAAEAATPGPWEHTGKDGNDNLETPKGTTMCSERYYPWVPDSEDFAYIALANPSTILELLAKLSAAEERIVELRLALSLTCELHGCGSESCTAAQYHEDAQKMIVRVMSTEERVRVLEKELRERK